MGTSYLVFPLSDEVIRWLDSEDIPHPPASPENRNPTPREIEAVLAKLSDYSYQIRRNLEEHTWYADVKLRRELEEGPWTEISVTDYRGDDIAHTFYFTKGWQEVIFLVTERLTHVCGPLAIADGSDATPFLVMPDAVVTSIIDEYNSR